MPLNQRDSTIILPKTRVTNALFNNRKLWRRG